MHVGLGESLERVLLPDSHPYLAAFRVSRCANEG